MFISSNSSSSDQATKIIKGEFSNDEHLTSPSEGQDVVISFLGPTKRLSAWNIAPGSFTNPYSTVFKAMRQCNVKHIFVIGTPNIHDPPDKSAAMATFAVFDIKILANAAYEEAAPMENFQGRG